MDDTEEFEPLDGAENEEEYDVMIKLDRLESLREDLVENNLYSLAEVEAALALLPPSDDPAAQARREILTDTRTEMLHFGLLSRETLEDKIDELNEQLDDLDEED